MVYLAITGQEIGSLFTIKHLKTGELIIWEHFGRMDDREYYAGFLSKLQAYARAGYYIGKNFIITCETSYNPLDIRSIQEIIKKLQVPGGPGI